MTNAEWRQRTDTELLQLSASWSQLRGLNLNVCSFRLRFRRILRENRNENRKKYLRCGPERNEQWEMRDIAAFGSNWSIHLVASYFMCDEAFFLLLPLLPPLLRYYASCSTNIVQTTQSKHTHSNHFSKQMKNTCAYVLVWVHINSMSLAMAMMTDSGQMSEAEREWEIRGQGMG